MSKTIRLTMAQALTRFLSRQMTEIDGKKMPIFGGVDEDGATDGKALDDGRVRRGGEGRDEFVLRRFETQQHDAAAPRIVLDDHLFDPGPGGRRGLRLELPPVGLDAERVEFLQRARNGGVVELAVLAGDDLDQ